MEKLTRFGTLPNGNLAISLTQAGVGFLADQVGDIGTLANWYALIEWQVCNGWATFEPGLYELTACPYGICRETDELEDPLWDKGAWWYPEYEVLDPVEVLYRDGRVVLTKVD